MSSSKVLIGSTPKKPHPVRIERIFLTVAQMAAVERHEPVGDWLAKAILTRIQAENPKLLSLLPTQAKASKED